MNITIPKETQKNENRIALMPSNVQKLVKLGANVTIESGLGKSLNISDSVFVDAGAKVATKKLFFHNADIVLRLHPPQTKEISVLKKNSLHISYLNPFTNHSLLQKLAQNNINAIAMEMIPRSTRAQKMDALSSQASLAGYVAVIMAADSINKIFPMMMTPAGTISPTRIFVIGAGVAGLQAIATAKRLGARVDAFDTRSRVEQEIQSLGAKFVKIDLGETGQTKDGYAKELTTEQLEKQRTVLKQYCSQADVVITTAQIFGKKAPCIITKEMVNSMKPGSVVVDLAIETGGNVEGTKSDSVIEINGVKIIGLHNIPSHVAADASQMYGNNLTNLIEEFWNKEKKEMNLPLDDEIIKSCLITYQGKIVHPMFEKIVVKKKK